MSINDQQPTLLQLVENTVHSHLSLAGETERAVWMSSGIGQSTFLLYCRKYLSTRMHLCRHLTAPNTKTLHIISLFCYAIYHSLSTVLRQNASKLYCGRNWSYCFRSREEQQSECSKKLLTVTDTKTAPNMKTSHIIIIHPIAAAQHDASTSTIVSVHCLQNTCQLRVKHAACQYPHTTSVHIIQTDVITPVSCTTIVIVQYWMLNVRTGHYRPVCLQGRRATTRLRQ